MGINKNQFAFLQEHAFKRCLGKKMLELGNQWMEIPGFGPDWAKAYYTNEGWEHISIDLSEEGGAIKGDLRVPGHFPDCTFDIMTDHGTLEHISSVDAQYKVFKNLHDWGKIGCVYTHVLPLQDKEHNSINGCIFGYHGFYGYSSIFWEEFTKACNYENLYAGSEYSNLQVTKYYSCAAYVKGHDSKFLSHEDFRELYEQHIDCYNSGSPV